MDIRVKAGEKAFELIRENGFDFDRVRVYAGPAVGPRWLVASGFDLTMIEKGLLGRTFPALLTGASAGAFRLAAWLQPEPEKSYRKLMEAYIGAITRKGDGPGQLLRRNAEGRRFVPRQRRTAVRAGQQAVPPCPGHGAGKEPGSVGNQANPAGWGSALLFWATPSAPPC